jgi:outer membrane lipoprotein SlyB
MNLPQDSLSRTLAAWRVGPRRDPQFRAAVHARIAGGAGTSWAAFARAHAPLVAGALAVAMVLGALTGREQARARVAADNGRIASAYVQSLDARAMAMR